MYQGFGKGDGGIVGGTDEEADFEDICESASAEESLMCRGTNSNGIESNLMVTARLCPLSGSVVWVRDECESAIMQRTVGMSQMTSMLHDKDRNDVYEKAIKLMIEHFQQAHGRDPVVLDIGTGTGLLAMFAAKHGAELVLGCEMFEAMASIAESVVKRNRLNDKINIISAKSTSIESLSPVRPDILISELLDSALLGEACMYSHADAINRFMDEGVTGGTGEFQVKLPVSHRVMPFSADVFASLVESEEVEQMHDVSNIHMHGFNPFRDDAAKLCPGGWSLIPVHWSELENRGGKLLSHSQKILDFEFFHSLPADQHTVAGDGFDADDDEHIPYSFGEGCFESDLSVTNDGTVHGILLWWKVYLLAPEIDPQRSVWYSTEPKVMNWQDHWLQVVFPLPQAIKCAAGDVIRITAAHDSLRMWLKAEKQSTAKVSPSAPIGSPTISTTAAGSSDGEEGNLKKVKISLSPTTQRASMAIAVEGKNVFPVPPQSRLTPSQCSCGWHLLCGAERIRSLNDQQRHSKWEVALSALLELMQGLVGHRDDVEGSTVLIPGSDNVNRIILDVSDGSVLAIAAALELRRMQMLAPQNTSMITETSPLSSLRIVSVEKKDYSRMFHDRLVTSNGVDDLMMVWDGEDWQDIVDWFAPDDDEDDEEGEGEGEGGEGTLAPSLVDLDALSGGKHVECVKVAALVSECFYYQLHALPTWQALSFLYKRSELDGQLEDNALVLPSGAFIMAAAVELTDLAGTYGKAGTISGFDHLDLDTKQENWHQNMFPYKLGGYRKRLLTKPIVIAILDYTSTARSLSDVLTQTPVLSDGRCDCIAVWVDYDLSPAVVNLQDSANIGEKETKNTPKDPKCHDSDTVLQQWDEGINDFPSHLKLNLKFFPTPIKVQQNVTTFAATTSFTVGDSDFKYDFKLL